MKKILFVLVLLCLEKALHAQTPRTPYIYTIKADSVKITNTCDTAELIIENHSQTVPGFLFNKGRGRTEFRRISQFNDTTVVIGGDTVHLGRGYKNFANADLTFDGDHIHNGAFHSVNLTDFSNIGFKSNSDDGTQSSEMTMNSYQGYTLNVNNATDPDRVRAGYASMGPEDFFSGVSTTTPDISQNAGLSMGDSRVYLGTARSDLNTGYWASAGVEIGVLTDYDPVEVDLFSKDGTMRLYTTNEDTHTQVMTNFNRGISWSNSVVDYYKGNSSILQTYNEFQFVVNSAKNATLRFMLPKLPVSTNSQDSVLVITDSGLVKKQAQSSLTPALNINQAEIVDVTAAVDAVTKLPHLYSFAGHSVTLPPAASYAGKKIYIWNQNYSTNLWTFAASITLPDGTTSNAIPNQSTMELLSDGNVWVKWK